MIFLYSLKLLGSNWVKALKYFLFYFVIWGICFALFLPTFFEFQSLIHSSFKSVVNSFSGVLGGSLGLGLQSIINVAYSTFVSAFEMNVGLFIYGLVVIFIFLPFLINIGKFAFCEMLYSYMTSKNNTGFFSALIRSLKKSIIFAFCKSLYNIFFFAITCACLYGVAQIEDVTFVTYALPFVLTFILVLLFSLNQMLVLGWLPASIVFDRDVFTSFRKGIKAVERHFWTTFGATLLFFLLFWGLVMIFGFYCMSVLVPLLSIILCVYNMTLFFSSQGMRFYYTENNILTPKKLEEVDKFSKTAYIL